ncbi:hypothetical protein KJZ61_02150 [Candidatus Dependentiae bacterium]|nr:hypothetical protein [Candidatus Dependentiae bacterium]
MESKKMSGLMMWLTCTLLGMALPLQAQPFTNQNHTRSALSSKPIFLAGVATGSLAMIAAYQSRQFNKRFSLPKQAKLLGCFCGTTLSSYLILRYSSN